MKVNSKHISCALAILSMASLAGFIGYSSSVSAITEQSDVNVNFTFNSVLGVSVSSDDLSIDDLAPGTAADSNIITINVLSNSPYGYTLNSTVGNSTYNNRNLTHATVNNATPFSSIDFGTTKASKESFSNSQWGYSFSLDNGTTWINATKTNGTTNDTGYSGLPLYSDSSHIATIKESSSTSVLNGDNVKFKIAAKADTTQIAGEYNNVINFQVTGNAAPSLYMQDVATWGSTLSTGDEITVKDSRDQKDYTVAKLADGNIWMTQNLDFDIVNGGANLSSANTDVPSNWADAGNLTNTYTTGTTTWNSSTTNPESYDPGNLCWDGTLNEDWGGNLDNETVACDTSNMHYHIGNYYNWTAAVAMNDSSSYTTNQQDVDQSICPAGWRLPTYSGSKSYANLVSVLSLTSGTSGNIHTSPVFFPYAGAWYGSSYGVGSFSFCWSSVVRDSDFAYALYFYVYDDLNPQDFGSRTDGASIRCVAR